MHRQELPHPLSPPSTGLQSPHQHQSQQDPYHYTHFHHRSHLTQQSTAPLQDKPQFIASFTHRTTYSPGEGTVHPPNNGPLRMKGGARGSNHSGSASAHEPSEMNTELRDDECVDSLHIQHHHQRHFSQATTGHHEHAPDSQQTDSPTPHWTTSRREPTHFRRQGPPPSHTFSTREGVELRLDHLDLQQNTHHEGSHSDYRDSRLQSRSHHPLEQRRSSASEAYSPHTIVATGVGTGAGAGAGTGAGTGSAAAGDHDTTPGTYPDSSSTQNSGYDYDGTSSHHRLYTREPNTQYFRHPHPPSSVAATPLPPSAPPNLPPDYYPPPQGGYTNRRASSAESVAPDRQLHHNHYHHGPYSLPHAPPHHTDPRGSNNDPAVARRGSIERSGSSPIKTSAALRPASFDESHNQGSLRRYPPEGHCFLPPSDYVANDNEQRLQQQHISRDYRQHSISYPTAAPAATSSLRTSQMTELSEASHEGGSGVTHRDMAMEDVGDIQLSANDSVSQPPISTERMQLEYEHSFRSRSEAFPSQQRATQSNMNHLSASVQHGQQTGSSPPADHQPFPVSHPQQQLLPPSHRSRLYAGQHSGMVPAVSQTSGQVSVSHREGPYGSPRSSHNGRGRSSLPTHEADTTIHHSEKSQGGSIRFGTRMPESIDLRAAIEVCDTLCKFAMHYGGWHNQQMQHFGGDSGYNKPTSVSLSEQERANILAIRAMNMKMLTGFRNGPRASENDVIDSAPAGSSVNNDHRHSPDNPTGSATGPNTANNHPGGIGSTPQSDHILFGPGPPSDDLTHEMAKAANSMFQLAMRIKSWINMTPEERVLDEEINIIRGRRSLVMEDQGGGGILGKSAVSSWVPVSSSLKSFAERMIPLDGAGNVASDTQDQQSRGHMGGGSSDTHGRSSTLVDNEGGRAVTLFNAQSSSHAYSSSSTAGSMGSNNMSGATSSQGASTSAVAPYQKYKKRAKRMQPPGRCQSCNSSDTPEWRRGPDGARTLCNACGLHYAKLLKRQQIQLRLNREGGAASLPPITFPLRPPQPGSVSESQVPPSSQAAEEPGIQQTSSPSPSPSDPSTIRATHTTTTVAATTTTTTTTATTINSLDLTKSENDERNAQQGPSINQSPVGQSPRGAMDEDNDSLQGMQESSEKPPRLTSSTTSGNAEQSLQPPVDVPMHQPETTLGTSSVPPPNAEIRQRRNSMSRPNLQVGDSPSQRNSLTLGISSMPAMASEHEPQLSSSPTLSLQARPATVGNNGFLRHSTPIGVYATSSNPATPSTTSGDRTEDFATGFSPSPELMPATIDRGPLTQPRRWSAPRQ
ncbi:hypothetical protein BGW42_005007 [Actinomortierella wolfii]|nr:hypothetical protein BGW42_005007 [Actinomortierella wolfii]